MQAYWYQRASEQLSLLPKDYQTGKAIQGFDAGYGISISADASRIVFASNGNRVHPDSPSIVSSVSVGAPIYVYDTGSKRLDILKSSAQLELGNYVGVSSNGRFLTYQELMPVQASLDKLKMKLYDLQTQTISVVNQDLKGNTLLQTFDYTMANIVLLDGGKVRIDYAAYENKYTDKQIYRAYFSTMDLSKPNGNLGNSTGKNPDKSPFELQPTATMLSDAVPSYKRYSGFTGTWYNPERDGEGWVIKALTNNQFLAYWYTYDQNNQPLYIHGSGEYDPFAESVTVNAQITQGTSFGVAFNKDAVRRIDWGEVTLDFKAQDDTCLLDISYQSSLLGYGAGKFENLTRLAVVESWLGAVAAPRDWIFRRV